MTSALRAARSSGTARLGLPVTLSAVVHVALVVLVLIAARGSRPRGEVYAVNLVAAAPGPRSVGIATESTPKTEPDAPLPKRAEETQPKETTPVQRQPAPRRTTSRATQVPDAKSARFDTPAPRAGGGETGGKGTDVANVSTGGKEFPYPAYLHNIITQIALRFDPRQKQALSADVQFVIRKDGSVFAISVLKPSGSYGFDLEAKGAVEAAGAARAFGELPDGFSDDALTVIFTFDPKIIR
ncbi:MAG TPA: TonB C-terminal domain-containing protein [Gemmatimonadaceae bacterium]